MFTGLINDIGEVTHVDAKALDRVITIRAPGLDLTRESIGASIACNGVCLTVTHKDAMEFTVMASAQTLDKTNIASWQPGTRINLEASLRVGDELGGHLVYGHVDGLAQCEARREAGNSIELMFSVPAHLRPFIAAKGSVALDGVSLTVNDLTASGFSVNLIPHTLQHTNFTALRSGARVNLEVDMLARYAARFLETHQLGRAA